MKGIFFRKFITMDEEKSSVSRADAVINASALETCGAYTTAGTYSYIGIVQLVTHLSTRTLFPIPELLRDFGQHTDLRFTLHHDHPA